jgi:hypothetical protein
VRSATARRTSALAAVTDIDASRASRWPGEREPSEAQIPRPSHAAIRSARTAARRCDWPQDGDDELVQPVVREVGLVEGEQAVQQISQLVDQRFVHTYSIANVRSLINHNTRSDPNARRSPPGTASWTQSVQIAAYRRLDERPVTEQ